MGDIVVIGVLLDFDIGKGCIVCIDDIVVVVIE